MNILSLTLNVDPRDLQVNRRPKHGHFLLPSVRKAMELVSSEVEKVISESSWVPTPKDRYAVHLIFCFPTSSSDVDGPVKRTVDSVFKGMRQVHDHGYVNDARVDLITAKKMYGLGHTFVEIVVDTVDTPGV